MNERFSGTVKWFDRKKGYGYITVDSELPYDVFVHYTYIKSPYTYKSLVEGERVTFGIVTTEKGTMAVDICPEIYSSTKSGVDGSPIE